MTMPSAKGWRHIQTAPRDGTVIWIIEPTSYGVFRAHYHTCCFWAEDGDLWPSHPSHWRPLSPLKPEHPGEDFYNLPHIKDAWRSNINDPEPLVDGELPKGETK